MNEFLVEIAVSGVEEIPSAELDSLRRAEAVRAAELAAEGTLLRLWRPDGPGWRNVGLWRACSEAALREAIDSLPLRPYMDVVCTLLREHPNDPGGLISRTHF
jgi:muconolactone D-isomerase